MTIFVDFDVVVVVYATPNAVTSPRTIAAPVMVIHPFATCETGWSPGESKKLKVENVVRF